MTSDYLFIIGLYKGHYTLFVCQVPTDDDVFKIVAFDSDGIENDHVLWNSIEYTLKCIFGNRVTVQRVIGSVPRQKTDQRACGPLLLYHVKCMLDTIARTRELPCETNAYDVRAIEKEMRDYTRELLRHVDRSTEQDIVDRSTEQDIVDRSTKQDIVDRSTEQDIEILLPEFLTGASYRSIDIECKEDTNRRGTRYV